MSGNTRSAFAVLTPMESLGPWGKATPPLLKSFRGQMLPSPTLWQRLDDPGQHLEIAKTLAHPFDSLFTLKPAHAQALGDLQERPLKMLRSWKEELEDRQAMVNKTAAWTAKRLGTKINTLLMERVQTLLDIDRVQ